MNPLDNFFNFKNPEQERIPTIPLYMDQMLDYLHSQLSPLLRATEETVFTKTMVNNYVKAGVLEPPHKKKYAQTALLDLILIYHFKQNHSLTDTKEMIQTLKSAPNHYERFLKTYGMCFDKTLKDFQKSVDESSVDELSQMMLDLAIEALVKKKFSEQLLDLIQQKNKENVDK